MVDPPARPISRKADPLVQGELEDPEILRRIEGHAWVALPDRHCLVAPLSLLTIRPETFTGSKFAKVSCERQAKSASR